MTRNPEIHVVTTISTCKVKKTPRPQIARWRRVRFEMLPIFLQARNSSLRMPRKVSTPFLENLTLLEFIIVRLRERGASRIFILTSSEEEDDEIEALGEKHGVTVFRGNLNDVQQRFIDATAFFDIHTFARVTADNPFVDYRLIEQAFLSHLENSANYTSSKFNRTFPIGIEIEIVDTQALLLARQAQQSPEASEHVTPFLYSPAANRLDSVRVQEFCRNSDVLSRQSVTVDTLLEFRRAAMTAKKLGPKASSASWEELVRIQLDLNS